MKDVIQTLEGTHEATTLTAASAVIALGLKTWCLAGTQRLTLATKLTSLPDELVQLTKLKIIFASNNLFETLPEVLGRCQSLEMIGFKSNYINQVPENSLPQKLRWLILTDNKIEVLANSLGERPRLQKLLLAGNYLTQLPQTLAQSSNLELVRISANRLTQCPTQLLALPKLAWLAFSGNPFSQSKIKIDAVPVVSSSSYTLQHIIGQGASGIISQAVWNEKQTQYPDKIAVKVFKGEVTSDGAPEDELQACLKVGRHTNLVESLAQVKESGYLALIMRLIPAHYKNLGLPPSLATCTRDTFPAGFTLSIAKIEKIIMQMEEIFEHLHVNQVCHGDLYAHNTLFDNAANIIFGDFGAATMYHMFNETQQRQIKQIEHRALLHFIDDLLSVCPSEDRDDEIFHRLKQRVMQ